MNQELATVCAILGELDTPAGRLLARMLASVALYETEVRKERQMAGIARVRAQNGGICPWGGRKPGTRIRVTEEKEELIRQLREEGESVSTISRLIGISRKTVYCVLESAK